MAFSIFPTHILFASRYIKTLPIPPELRMVFLKLGAETRKQHISDEDFLLGIRSVSLTYSTVLQTSDDALVAL
jgi:hypothetical protein